MAKKRKKSKEEEKLKVLREGSARLRERVREEMPRETQNGIWVVFFLLAGVFFVLAAFGHAGPVGRWVHRATTFLVGTGYFLFPLASFITSISFFYALSRAFPFLKVCATGIFFAMSIGFLDLLFHDTGGFIGGLIASPLLALFDFPASVLILLGIIVMTLLIIFETDVLMRVVDMLMRKREGDGAGAFEDEDNSDYKAEVEDEEGYESVISEEEDYADQEPLPVQKEIVPESTPKKNSGESFLAMPSGTFATFVPPPLSLLERDKGKPAVGDVKANANIIKRTLANFGIKVEMDEVSIGPSVTRYALKPAEGVKLSRILGLKNDLALSLAAHPIRIEAPIPGKSLVGIEIPNSVKSVVGLATLLGSPEIKMTSLPLMVALGKGISGKSLIANIAKMPHVLIAGATGSGKSVTIHTIITSLLFRNGPENLRLLMIDPKRVELTLYNSIPHLLTPVITSAKQAILSLKWAAKEMDRRYDVLEKRRVRDIDSYRETIVLPAYTKFEKIKNKKSTPEDIEEASRDLPERMPYIVIIIDELADLMQAYPRELEASIVRLAQMSRAVGIHLILSTQRPSVNVITGLIKANIPARIALQVSSQVDSRTILDTIGAEALLGAGDMLYLSGEMSKPQRIQSAYISEIEVKRVVTFLADQYADTLPSELALTSTDTEDGGVSIFDSLTNERHGEDGDLEDDDDLYEEARETIVHAGKASTSFLQRKLRIGYARAARLMDLLEERGVIGPADGAKPRDVVGNTSTRGESDGDDADVNER